MRQFATEDCARLSRCSGLFGQAARRVVRNVLLVSSALLISTPAISASIDDYRRADRVRGYDNRRVGGTIFPHWLADGRRFYYRSFGAQDSPGTVYLVDPTANSKRALFTMDALTQALRQASASDAAPSWRLLDDTSLVAKVGGKEFRCDIAPMVCERVGSTIDSVPIWATRSPDGKWDAFVWNYNVYIKPASSPRLPGTASKPAGSDSNGNYILPLSEWSAEISDFSPTGQRSGCDFPAPSGRANLTPPAPQPPPSDAIALTTDGERLYSYGPRWKGGAEPATIDADRYRPTSGSFYWSPDSRKLVVRREDIRGVGTYPLYSSTSDQPVDHSYFYAAPGAAHIPQYDLYVIDVESREASRVDVPATGLVLRPSGAQWSADSRSLVVLTSDRAPKTVTLWRVDPETGTARPIIIERSKNYVQMGVGGGATIAAISPNEADVIWFSERDGWPHLYLYNGEGRLQNQIDTGKNAVAELIRVDYDRRQLYFTAWGRGPGNPYYRHLYRVGFDGRDLTSLTPEDGDHAIAMSPDGSYLLDTVQTIDRPPVTIARTLDGQPIMPIAQGDDAGLKAIGWRSAEVFTVRARDGKTDLWGVMYKPSNFNPSKRYPVVVNIYPGPFMGSVGYHWRFQGGDNMALSENQSRRATHGEGMGQALAELGFIVIKLNSLGTSQRSRAMQDYFQNNLVDNGLPDQIAAVRQLAARNRWIDQDRVGIFGHSGGGYAAAAGLLTHPEFFKVGVAQAGNHDLRSYGWYWGEQYMGPLESGEDRARYARQANLTYAANLKGKLLLVHGDMDCNNPPSQTLRLADALTRENKDFDLLIVPDAGHQMPPYVMRRSWDYFVENLARAPTTHEFTLQEPVF